MHKYQMYDRVTWHYQIEGISIQKCLSFVQQLIDEDIIAYITNIKNVKRLLYSHSYIVILREHEHYHRHRTLNNGTMILLYSEYIGRKFAFKLSNPSHHQRIHIMDVTTTHRHVLCMFSHNPFSNCSLSIFRAMLLLQ